MIISMYFIWEVSHWQWATGLAGLLLVVDLEGSKDGGRNITTKTLVIIQMTRDEDVLVEWFFSRSVVWRARWGERKEGREIKIFHLDGSVHFGSHFSPICPPQLQSTQEMHVLPVFALSKIFFICNYTARDFILNEPKIEVGEKENLL